MNLGFQAFKALVGALALLSAKSEAQQSLFSIVPEDTFLTLGDDMLTSCNVSSIFNAESSVSVFNAGKVPYTQIVPFNGVVNVPYKTGDILRNNGENGVFLNFNVQCSQNNNYYNPTGESACIPIGNGTDVNCTLFQTPSNLFPNGAPFRMVTSNYVPNTKGAAVDLSGELEINVPYSVLYSSDNISTMEVLPMTTIDQPNRLQGTVFMQCIQQASKNISLELAA